MQNNPDMPPPGWKVQTAYGDKMRSLFSPQKLKSPASMEDLIDMVGMLVDAHKKLVVAYNQFATRTIEKVHALEARPELKYAGVWNSEKVYGAGTFVTDQGSMFYAQKATVGERPGSSESWVLSVKRGKDGKDLR